MSLNKKTLYTILSTFAIILVGLGLFFIYNNYKEGLIKTTNSNNTTNPIKTITVNVVVNTETQTYNKTYEISTEETYLGNVLVDNLNVVTQGNVGQRYVTAVDGFIANKANEEWWKILINGSMGNFGLDEQPINDGDIITLEFNIGFNAY